MAKKTEKTPAKSTKSTSFVQKYGVDEARIYKGNVDALEIPPPGHPLHDPTSPTKFDELRVAEIDKDGKMTTPIEFWASPDEGKLWIVDGRGRKLDIDEVNRRRAKDGREEVKPLLVPFSGTEQEAVARIRTKNYHRRSPTPSGIAQDILALRNAGYPWAEVAAKLHYTEGEPEGWCKRMLPLAFCVREVQAAFDAGVMPLVRSVKFGGRAVDGSEALGKKAQLELLAEMTAKKASGGDKKVKPISNKVRARVQIALEETTSFKNTDDKLAAAAIAAALRFVAGDMSALNGWTEVSGIVVSALMPIAKEPKPPKEPKAPKEKKVKAPKGKKQEELFEAGSDKGKQVEAAN